MVWSPSDLLLTMEPGFKRETAPVDIWEQEIQSLGSESPALRMVEPNSGDEILWTPHQNAKHSRPPLLPEMYDSVGDGFVFSNG